MYWSTTCIFRTKESHHYLHMRWLHLFKSSVSKNLLYTLVFGYYLWGFNWHSNGWADDWLVGQPIVVVWWAVGAVGREARHWPSCVSISSTWVTLASCGGLSAAGVWFMFAGRATEDSRPLLFDISCTNTHFNKNPTPLHNFLTSDYHGEPTFNARGSLPLDLVKNRWKIFSEFFSSTWILCVLATLIFFEDEVLIFKECLLAARPMSANFITRAK